MVAAVPTKLKVKNKKECDLERSCREGPFTAKITKLRKKLAISKRKRATNKQTYLMLFWKHTFIFKAAVTQKLRDAYQFSLLLITHSYLCSA